MIPEVAWTLREVGLLEVEQEEKGGGFGWESVRWAVRRREVV